MEIKILDIDPTTIQNKLEAMGAVKVFDGVRTITYFKNRNEDGPPRLKLTEEHKLKLSVRNSHTQEEVKLFVSRKEECLQLLAALEYDVVSEVKARRISYELNMIDLDVDQFPGIPAFIEVDMGKNTALSFDELINKLGLKNKPERAYIDTRNS